MTTEMVLTHKWQEQGLGQAPFQAVAVLSMPSPALAEANPAGYNNAMAEVSRAAANFGVSLCSCNSCGQSLANNVVIRDAAGKHFVVGLDCAGRTHDARLIKQAELLEKRRKQALRLAARQAAGDARRAANEARLEAQRQVNGGLTDDEVREREQAAREQFSVANAWLLEVLEQESGDFCQSIARQLKSASVGSVLGGRALNIVAEIYAKRAGGRRNSKAYEAAYTTFQARIEA